MTDSLLKDRTYLHERHRLSHQQIDHWLGENRAKEFLSEKLKQLEAVKNFLSVTDLLTKNGITYTCVKGPLLSFRIYKDPTIRISHDIDLLIDKTMISKTIDILIQNDFQLQEETPWPLKKNQQELFLKVFHHLCFYNQEQNIYVEIHWVLTHELPVSQKKIKHIISENRTKIKFSGKSFFVLSPEFELLYLLIHGARHGWSRLKWLIDIKDYPMHMMNASNFENLVTQLQAWRIIAQVNLLLEHFLNEQMPFSKKKRVPSYFIDHVYTVINDYNTQRFYTRKFQHIRYLWFLFPSIYHKYHMLSFIFLRRGDLSEIDSSFKITYYLYRPFSFIRRRVLNV